MRRCWWDIQTSLLHTAALVWGRVSKSSGLPFFQLSLSFSTQCFLKSGHTVLPVLEQGLTVTQCLFSLPFLGMPSVINICYLTERKLFFLQIVCGDAERMLNGERQMFQMGAWRYIREGGISEGIPKVALPGPVPYTSSLFLPGCHQKWNSLLCPWLRDLLGNERSLRFGWDDSGSFFWKGHLWRKHDDGEVWSQRN